MIIISTKPTKHTRPSLKNDLVLHLHSRKCKTDNLPLAWEETSWSAYWMDHSSPKLLNPTPLHQGSYSSQRYHCARQRYWGFDSLGTPSQFYTARKKYIKKIKTSWIFTNAVVKKVTRLEKSLGLYIHNCPLLHFRKQRNNNKTQLFTFYFYHLKLIYGLCLFTRCIKAPVFSMLDPEITPELNYQWKHTARSAGQSLSC